MYTPWGKATQKHEIAPGIVFYSTNSHGGFRVSKERLAVMPDALVNPSGWYEEDCEYSKVVLAFPEYFKSEEQANAVRAFKYWFNEDGTPKKRYG